MDSVADMVEAVVPHGGNVQDSSNVTLADSSSYMPNVVVSTREKV